MYYSKLAKLYQNLENTPSRLDKVSLISDFLERCSDDDIKMSILLLQGKVFPKWSEKEIGIASKTAAKIVSSSSGMPPEKVMKEYSEVGDLGSVAEKFIESRKQMALFTKKLTLEKVFDNFRRLAETDGLGSADRKAKLVAELMTSASPIEAKYIIRTITEELRIGVAEGVIRDSIAKTWFSGVEWLSNAGKKDRLEELFSSTKDKKFLLDIDAKDIIVRRFLGEDSTFFENNSISEEKLDEYDEKMLWKKESGIDYIITADDSLGNRLLKTITDSIEWAWFLAPDYSEVALLAKNEGITGLKNAKVAIGKPMQVLLADKSPSLEDAINEYETCAIEVKYDGMRLQIHKENEKVWLFTRRMENVTPMFPDIVELIRKNVSANTCVIEGENLGVDPKTGKPVPFQMLSRRIHRKYDIHKMAEEVPIQLNLFDIVFLNEKMLFGLPFSERRKRLSEIVTEEAGKLQLAKELVTKDIREAEKFYRESLAMGQEGVMVKNMDAPYQPGKRVAGGWLKVKPIMETLDLVVSGAVWGTGKRAGWFGSFMLSCRGRDGKFHECGMMGTGIKEKKSDDGDVTFMDLTEMIKPDITKESENIVTVKPKIVLEIAYEEIQESTNYEAGYALRFPRLVRIREDREPNDCDTIERIKSLYFQQRGRDK